MACWMISGGKRWPAYERGLITLVYGRQGPLAMAECDKPSRPEQSPFCGALQCLLQISRSPLFDRSALVQLLEPPYTDPYVRWCGRGGAERLPPIPINGAQTEVTDAI